MPATGAFSPNPANYVPLSPISFLKRAAFIYRDREATAYNGTRRTWGQVGARCRAFASVLKARGIGAGETVSVIAPNIPEMFELHFAVPMAGAVLNAINTRLEADTVAYILDHSEARLVICDTAFAPLLRAAFKVMGRTIPVIDIVDASVEVGNGFARDDYETLIASGDPDADWGLPDDEWHPLSLNYTSGTSGRPKGVIYHHRGAYLMAMGTAVGWDVGRTPVYMSVVPMFHCNGWNHPWMVPILGGRLVFTRDPVPAKLFRAIADEGVTHFGAAPIILQMMAASPDAPKTPFDPPVRALTAGAPPPPAVLERAARIGIEVMQVYGLTETYGHISQCLWQDEWDDLTPSEQAEMQALQGVAFPMVEEFRVIDRATGRDVPADGQTQGEIAIRGNTVMAGYMKNPKATADSFEDGLFWSGDAAVMRENGYVQIRDRLKDVIISGGENISSVEVEAVLYRHPDINAAAVVAREHPKWGETPCAFIELRDGATEDADAILGWCRERLAGFKTPKSVVFGELPKTATGKIQKFILRERARELGPMQE
jgi:fatty-acyl-CoA synthase